MEPIKVKKLREGAILPTYGTPFSAGADLYACLEESVTIRVTADATQIEPIVVAPLVAIPMLLVLLIVLMIPKRRKIRGYDKW